MGKFDDVQNFSRLISVLQGPAAKCVQHLMLNPINVPKIMKRLEENYGNPEVIYRELVSNIQKIKKESNHSVLEISEALENLVNNKTALGKPEYLNDHR